MHMLERSCSASCVYCTMEPRIPFSSYGQGRLRYKPGTRWLPVADPKNQQPFSWSIDIKSASSWIKLTYAYQGNCDEPINVFPASYLQNDASRVSVSESHGHPVHTENIKGLITNRRTYFKYLLPTKNLNNNIKDQVQNNDTKSRTRKLQNNLRVFA